MLFGGNSTSVQAVKSGKPLLCYEVQSTTYYLHGCRYLTKVQTAQDEDVNTQAALEQILGQHIYLAHGINKLLLLENAVYQ